MNGELVQEASGRVKLTIPAVIFLVVVTWAASALVTYGVITTRIEWLQQRVEVLEKNESLFVPRTEYESGRADIANRLDRIERKIDALK